MFTHTHSHIPWYPVTWVYPSLFLCLSLSTRRLPACPPVRLPVCLRVRLTCLACVHTHYAHSRSSILNLVFQEPLRFVSPKPDGRTRQEHLGPCSFDRHPSRLKLQQELGPGVELLLLVAVRLIFSDCRQQVGRQVFCPLSLLLLLLFFPVVFTVTAAVAAAVAAAAAATVAVAVAVAVTAAIITGNLLL